VLNLYRAFQQANQMADAQRREHIEYHLAAGLIAPEAGIALARPVLHHGIAANRAALETAARYSQEQGLTPRRVELEDLFAASTMMQ
jgi:hypothetical protein